MGLATQEVHFKTKEDFNVEYNGQFFAAFKRYGMNIDLFKS